jgi:xylan 1,4-beta-xylosidase
MLVSRLSMRFRLITGFLTLSVCLAAAAARAQPAPRAAPETITLNATAPARPFPHFWEQMFGSGRAALALRSGYRRDLRAVKRVTGFDYLRFHGIFDDDVGLYSQDSSGNPAYNFTYVDQIYDGLLARGVRPFVELSFMPKALAANLQQQAFWYHPHVAPPRDWTRWGELVSAFARHLIARYGIEEVSKWYFEVWNEPNIDFWRGEPKQATYFQLYDTSARALKAVSPRLRVGGPATAQAAWIPAFIRHCVEEHVPVDFVSTHVYGNDSAENVFGTHERITRKDMVVRAVEKVHEQVRASARPDLPVIFSEYNASYMNEVDVTDSAFMGPWLAETISRCDGLVKMLAYWSFSDVFEEQGIAKRPFYGGYGLVAVGHIPKASFNAFALLHRLGEERLEIHSDSALATRRADGSLVVALWNYAPPGKSVPAKQFTLDFQGLALQAAARRALIYRLDRQHGSALNTWEAMGKPDFPSRRQQKILREAGRLLAPEITTLPPGPNPSLALTVPSHGMVLVEISQ